MHLTVQIKNAIVSGSGKILRRWLQQAIDRCLSSMQPVYIIQIGANDGKRLDFVRTVIEKFAHRALLAEPVPQVFQSLQKHYGSFPQVRCLPLGVSDNDTTTSLPFFTLQPVDGLPFNPDFTLWGSFDEQHLEKFRKAVPHFDELKTTLQVPVMEMNRFIASASFPRIDLLQVDAEGWDIKLLQSMDLQRWQPGLIRFEHIHAPKKEVFALLGKLASSGYYHFSLGMDTLAVHSRHKKYFTLLRLAARIRPQWLQPAREPLPQPSALAGKARS